ncbi:MAG: hypothetical protein ABIG28_02635 [archaeon]
MLFNKKNKNLKKCEDCGSRVEDKFSFCPHCGNSFLDPQDEEDYGLLGRDDSLDVEEENYDMFQGFGITDKIIGTMFNSIMKSLNKQFKNQLREMDREVSQPEIRSFPNGISIRLSGPLQQRKKKQGQEKKAVREITEEQLKKISSLPKSPAKTNVKRLGNKVVYELSTPGVTALEDIFISKLESGYEIKAIGSKKVYVNSVPINLPLRQYSIVNNKLLVEFSGIDG